MTRITLDDEVVSLARRFRKEALASLVTVLRDEHAPASARAAASAKLLEYSDGKPSQARQLTVADVGQMTPELRQELLHALLVHYQTELPKQFQAMLKASVDEALRLQAALPRPNRFQRRAPLPPALNSLRDPIRAGSSAVSAPPAASQPAQPDTAVAGSNRLCGGEAPRLKRPLKSPDNVVVLPEAPRLSDVAKSPDNVVVMPGTARVFNLRRVE